MEFYFNENHLIKSEDDRVESLKELKVIYDILTKNNSQVFIKDNFDYSKISDPKYRTIYGLFQRFKIISTSDCEVINGKEITPYIDNEGFHQLVSLCLKNNNDKIFSNSNENEIVHPTYKISDNEIKNLVGRELVEKYLLLNPTPKSMKEVFDRAQNQFKHIRFTDEAYKTAQTRWDIYSKFGLQRLFLVFRVLDEVVYPFLRGDNTGFSERDIIDKFKSQTKGIEFSNESVATMKKYANERTVTVKGRKLVMSYHIKIVDSRIYFKYDSIDDCIYIGHSGGHLYTINHKGN